LTGIGAPAISPPARPVPRARRDVQRLLPLLLALLVAAPAVAQDGGDDVEGLEGDDWDEQDAEPTPDEGADLEGDDLEGDDWDAQEEDGEPYEPASDPAEAVSAVEASTLCDGRRIRRIRVDGNRRVSDDDVLATIRLRAGQVCRSRLVTRDARALWDAGFFDDIRIEAVERGERIDLSFDLRERPAIGRIVFEGNDEIEDSDLTEEIDLEEGGIFRVRALQRQLAAIRDKYADEGFFLARVDYRLDRMDNNQVRVVFTVDEGERVTVRRVRFVGNRHISSDDLSGIMQTRATGFFSFIANDDRFDRQAFEEDTTRLAAYYFDQGYLTMRVGTPRIELTADRAHIDVTVPLEEGPRFRIGRLTVRELDSNNEEVEPLGGRRGLRERLPLEPGDWFNRTQIAQGLIGITRRYRDEGYAQVQVEPETDLDMERRVVNVAIVIRRGPPILVERIQIRGNTKTRDSVIRREIQLIEGELYSQTQAEESQRRIQALGYFERVEIAEEEGSQPDRIVITVEVGERATGTFQVGAGFSSIESFILTGQVQQDNLFGNGQSLSLQLQISGIRQFGQLRFTEPWLFGTEWLASLEAFRTVRQFSFFTRESTGGGLTLGHPIFDNRFRVFVNYRADFVDIGAATGGLFGAQSLAQQGLQLFNQAPFENLFRDGLTSSIRLTLTWDGRDNRLFPTDGFFASWSTEFADQVIGSDNTFVRHNLDVRGYIPLFAGVVFRARGVGGLITSRIDEGVPLYERFFLGGIFNLRGFPLNSLGPRVGIPPQLDPNALVSDRGLAIGGNAQFFYNLEIEFPILQEVGIRGVVFTDGGNAWNLNGSFCSTPAILGGSSATDPCNGVQGFDPFDIRTSWGFGLRWVSPLGPLRFEWGIPFQRNEALNENAVDFQFTIGNFF
jgi:outer membrane protein insertion porin family